MDSCTPLDPALIIHGGGEMGRLVREKDWAQTPSRADRLVAAEPPDDSEPLSGLQLSDLHRLGSTSGANLQ